MFYCVTWHPHMTPSKRALAHDLAHKNAVHANKRAQRITHRAREMGM